MNEMPQSKMQNVIQIASVRTIALHHVSAQCSSGIQSQMQRQPSYSDEIGLA